METKGSSRILCSTKTATDLISRHINIIQTLTPYLLEKLSSIIFPYTSMPHLPRGQVSSVYHLKFLQQRSFLAQYIFLVHLFTLYHSSDS